MWHGIVSIVYASMNQVMFQLVDMFWRFPLVASGFLLGFAILTVMLWIEVIKESAPLSRAGDRFGEVEVIRLRP